MSDLTAAFARADQARAAIATIIDKVRTAEFDLADAFAAGDADPLTGRCFAVKVIEVVPDIGKVRARRTMEEIGMAEGVWLADVTTEHRRQIIEALSSDPA